MFLSLIKIKNTRQHGNEEKDGEAGGGRMARRLNYA